MSYLASSGQGLNFLVLFGTIFFLVLVGLRALLRSRRTLKESQNLKSNQNPIIGAKKAQPPFLPLLISLGLAILAALSWGIMTGTLTSRQGLVILAVIGLSGLATIKFSHHPQVSGGPSLVREIGPHPISVMAKEPTKPLKLQTEPSPEPGAGFASVSPPSANQTPLTTPEPESGSVPEAVSESIAGDEPIPTPVSLSEPFHRSTKAMSEADLSFILEVQKRLGFSFSTLELPGNTIEAILEVSAFLKDTEKAFSKRFPALPDGEKVFYSTRAGQFENLEHSGRRVHFPLENDLMAFDGLVEPVFPKKMIREGILVLTSQGLVFLSQGDKTGVEYGLISFLEVFPDAVRIHFPVKSRLLSLSIENPPLFLLMMQRLYLPV